MTTEKTDQNYMKRAIELAQKGKGKVDPNPLVGAVIVKNDRIIGEGFHEKYGSFHAERNAIADAKSKGNDLKGASIYVSLEPCCHHGKTPPCTEAIIQEKISRVIAGSLDPNPQVSGKGITTLQNAGVETKTGVLKQECDALNKKFFTYITTGHPHVLMKYAMTSDGKIATHTGASKWISCEKSRDYVQEMRNEYPAIMAGIGTVLADDPLLTCRIEGARSPIRIIIDSSLKTPENSKIIQTSKDVKTIIACAIPEQNGLLTAQNAPPPYLEKVKRLTAAGAQLISLPGEDKKTDLTALMKYLGEQKITGVLLEGGATLNSAAIKSGIVNEINIFLAPKIFAGKAKSPVEGIGADTPDDAVKLQMTGAKTLGTDLLITYDVIG